MATIAELLIKLGMDDGGLDKGMSSAQSKLKSWGDNLKSVGTKLTAGVTVPLVGAGVAALNWASDQAEASNKVDVVFGKNAAEVKKWAKSNKGSLLLSNAAALDYVGTLGNMTTSMGFQTDEAATLSEGWVELSQDLSSFNNVPVDEALNAIRAGLVGEYEPLRRLGVVLDDATVKQKAFEMGLYSGTGALDSQARVLAVNELLYEQTTNAQGDAARTAEGFANQSRILGANLRDLGATIGERLLPVANRFLSWLLDLVDRLANLDPMWQNIILGFAGLAAAIGPALLALGFMLPAIGALIPVFAALVSPIGLVALALVALVGIGIYAWVNDLWGVRDAVSAVTDYLRGFRPALDDVIDALQALRDGDFDEFFYELRDAVFSFGAALASQQLSKKLREIADETRKASESSKDYPKTLQATAEALDSNASSVDHYRSAFQNLKQGNYGEALKQLALGANDANTAFVQYGATLFHFLGETGLKFISWIGNVSGAKLAWTEFKNALSLAIDFDNSGIGKFLKSVIDKATEAKKLIDDLIPGGGGDGGKLDPFNDPRRYEPTKSQPGSNEGAGYPFVGGEMVTTLPAVGSGPQSLYDKIKGIGQQIGAAVQGIFTSVSNSLRQVDSAFQQTAQTVGSTLQQLQSRVQQSFQQITQAATNSTNQLKSAVQSGWQQMQSQVASAAQQMQQRVQQTFTQMQSQSTSAINQMRSAVQSGMQAMVSAASSAMSQFSSQVQSGMQRAVAATQSGVNQIRGVVAGLNLSSQGYSIGASLGQGIASGIQAYIGTVAAAAAALVSAAISAAQSAAAAHSPSRKMMALGGDMAEGLAIGLQRGADSVAAATAGLIDIPDANTTGTAATGQPVYVSIALKSQELVELIRNAEAGGSFAMGFGSELGLYTGQP